MTPTEKVALAMAWYDSGLEDRANFQTLMESILAQPEQEPVAWFSPSGNLYKTRYHATANGEQVVTPLYTHPPQNVIDKSAAKRIATALGWEPQRTWVGLTLTQVKLLGEGVQEEAIKSGHSRDWVFYTHINEALKEKNK
jgi:hypothetical protein